MTASPTLGRTTADRATDPAGPASPGRRTADAGPRRAKQSPDDVRDALRHAHAQPRHDLATLPWVPVLHADGRRGTVGLRELLLNAHTYRDIDVPDPLSRAALRRYLTASTALLVRLCGLDEDSGHARLDSDAGFTITEVNTYLARTGDHLWLYHPDTPFLQDVRLRTALVTPDWSTTAELVHSQPGGSEAAWFRKPGDAAATAGLDPPEAALALVRRWYYTLNGNIAPIRTPSGIERAQCGSPAGEGPAQITHVFRVGRTLFSTLLRNLTTDLVTAPGTSGNSAVTGPAWLDPQQPRASRDPLYQASLTGTTVLLGPERGGRVHDVVRGAVLLDKELARALRNAACDQDPHRILAAPAAPKPATKPTSKAVRLPAGASRVQHLNDLRRHVLDQGIAPHGVLSETRLWLSGHPCRRTEDLELLIGKKQGSSTSPKWSVLEAVTLAAPTVDGPFAQLDGVLAACFAPRTGLQDKIARAVCLALPSVGPSGMATPSKPSDEPAQSTIAAARAAWLAVAAGVVDGVISGQLDEATATEQLYAAARDAFGTALTRYAHTVRFAPHVIAARRTLRSPA